MASTYSNLGIELLGAGGAGGAAGSAIVGVANVVANSNTVTGAQV